MMNTLPKEEAERIEAAAKEYADGSHDLYDTTYNASAISFFAGAKREYMSSVEREKKKSISFWKFCLKKGYKLTLASDEIYAEFIESQKK